MHNKIDAIEKRYTSLAEDNCCLSCGKALEHSEVREGDRCLDIGSGRGRDVIRMAEKAGKTGFAYGLDISEGMIEKACKTAGLLGVGNVEFIKSEIETIPIEDNSINLVISNCVINHASDKSRVWKEIFRVLKEGGCFTVSDIYSTEPVPAEYADDPQAVAECWAGAVTKDKYLEILNDAGFKKIEIIEESKPYPKGKIMTSSFTIRGFK